MITISSIKELPSFDLSKKIALTIGSFDGVHLGHLALFKRLREKVGEKGITAVFTFKNHPSTLLSGRPPVKLLTTPEEKLHLLKQAGIDLVILVEFTPEFMAQPFDLFLKNLKSHLPFSFLVLGEGAAFGKNKQGDKAHVSQLAKELKCEVEYLQKTTLNGQPISSGTIRKLIAEGNLALASSLLGRPL